MDYSLEFPSYYEDAAAEIEAKGFFEHATITVGARRLRPVFYDPIRLRQEIDDAIAQGLFAEPGIVVVPSATRAEIERAVESLARPGFSDLMPEP